MSRSCTAMSLKTPPPPRTYSTGGGEGSRDVSFTCEGRGERGRNTTDESKLQCGKGNREPEGATSYEKAPEKHRFSQRRYS